MKLRRIVVDYGVLYVDTAGLKRDADGETRWLQHSVITPFAAKFKHYFVLIFPLTVRLSFDFHQKYVNRLWIRSEYFTNL